MRKCSHDLTLGMDAVKVTNNNERNFKTGHSTRPVISYVTDRDPVKIER